MYTLTTDGSCKGPGKPGAWAFVLRNPETGECIIQTKGCRSTTISRMEMLAVIRGLEYIKPLGSDVTVITDSEYLRKGVNEWLPLWTKNGYKRTNGKLAKNADLWQRMQELLALHNVTVTWVKGHTGHPDNELCDQIAGTTVEKYVDR